MIYQDPLACLLGLEGYLRALELAQTEAERRSLNDQLTRLSSG